MTARRFFAGLVVGALVFFAIGAVLYADCGKCSDGAKCSKKVMKPQTVCPVSGAPIKKDAFVDVKGHRIYLCCPSMGPKVKADPDKYLAKIREKGERPMRLCDLKDKDTCPPGTKKSCGTAGKCSK